MTDAEIQAIAVGSGFELKDRADGSKGLHPYVFAFARALLAERERGYVIADRNALQCVLVALTGADEMVKKLRAMNIPAAPKNPIRVLLNDFNRVVWENARITEDHKETVE
jgi:hypothetical protein